MNHIHSATAERLWSSGTVTSISTARIRLHEWNCKQRERGLSVSPSIYNTNKGLPWLGYCRKPFDPFITKFLF